MTTHSRRSPLAEAVEPRGKEDAIVAAAARLCLGGEGDWANFSVHNAGHFSEPFRASVPVNRT